jgi:hypothetical protein
MALPAIEAQQKKRCLALAYNIQNAAFGHLALEAYLA